MKRWIMMATALFLPLVTLTCSGEELLDINPNQDQNQEASKQKKENIATVVRDNKAFAFQLYSFLSKSSGNLIFSPFSISSAFAMVYTGAAGETEAEMKRTFHFSLSEEDLNKAMSQLTRDFTSYNREDNPDFRLLINNSIWADNSLVFLPDYIQRLLVDYQYRVRRVDFATQTEAARIEINRWVREHTYGRIIDIVPPGGIDSSTRLMLVSAIYLKARWEQLFNPQLTRQAPFFPNREKTVSVSMMENTSRFNFFKGENVSMLELPYLSVRSSELNFSFMIILPNETTGLTKVEEELTPDQIVNWMSEMKPQRVNAIIPKFTITKTLTLNETLEHMGMTLSFSRRADFSKMTGTKELAISKAIHKAFIVIDESGTEAAAATTVSMNLTSIATQLPSIVFRADHPFIFFIIEKSTGTVLFIGRFESP